MKTYIIFACIVGILSIGWLCACSKKTMSAEERIVLQLREGIRVGDSKEEVENLLKRLKVEYEFLPTQHQFVGIVRRINPDALGYKSVRFMIAIDKNGRVSKFSTQDFFTGP